MMNMSNRLFNTPRFRLQRIVFTLVLVLLDLTVLSGTAGIVLASDISFAEYFGTIRITNADVSANNVSTVMTLDSQVLIDHGYISANFSNMAIRTQTGADARFMPSTNSTNPWCLWVDAIGDYENLDYLIYTGPNDMASTKYYFPADAGMTTSDSATLELSDNFSMTWAGMFDTDNDSDKNIIDKQYAIRTFISPTVSGNITADIYNYESPASADGSWVDDAYAVDEDTGTTANYTFIGGVAEWSPYETATLTDTLIRTSAVRFWVTRSNSAVNKIDIDIYYSGGWHNIYSANPAWGEYVIADAGGFYDVSQIRLRAYNSSSNNYIVYLHEYEPIGVSATSSVTGIASGEYTIEVAANAPFLSIGIDAATSPITPESSDLVYNLPFRQTDFNTSGANFTSLDTFQHECDPVGNTAWSATGFSFDGAGDYVSIPGSTINTTRGTFILWVWFDRDNTAEYLFSENGGELALYHNGSKELRLQYDGVDEINTNIGTTYKDPYTGEWIHIAFAFQEGSYGRCYINGSQVTNDPSINAGGFTAGTSKIGAYSNGANAFQGDIGEFVYYDVRVAESVIDQHYEATKAHFTSGDIYTQSSVLTTVPDNANDYTSFENQGMPYVEYQDIYTGGNQQQYIDWEYDDTTFEDESSGNHDASPTFRTASTDADVTATLLTFEPVTPATAPAYSVSAAPDFVTENFTVSSSFTSGNVTSGGVPGEDLIDEAAEESGTPNTLLWGILGAFTCALGGLGVSYMERQHGAGRGSIFIRIMIAVTVFGIMIALEKFDFWVMVIYLMIVLAPALASQANDVGGSVSTLNFIGFLSMTFICLTIINQIQEGYLLASANTEHLNTLMFTQEFTLLNVFHLPIINTDFFTQGLTNLLQWDNSFFGGNAQLIQYMLYSLTAVASVIVLGFVIGTVSSFFARIGT